MGGTKWEIMTKLNKHIDELIVRVLSEDCTSEDKRDLNAWLEQSEENSRYYKQMQKVWINSRGLESFRSVDVMSDFNEFKTRVGMQPKVVQLSLKRTIMKIAAVMVPAIMLLAGYSLYQSVPGFGKWQSFATVNDTDEIILIDHSEVTLNTNSSLVYQKDFKGKERRLKLKGEAYFKVAKNPEKPFIVKVGKTEVKVLGTEFNLDENSDGSVYLAVTEGKVLFSANNEKTHVVAGEQAVFKDGTIRKSSLASDNCIAWKTGSIVFENATLSEVLETVLDHFNEVETIVNNSTETNLSMTSRFNNPSLEDVLVELRIHFKKKVEINDNKLIISD